MSSRRRQLLAADPAAINPGKEDSDADAILAVEDSAANFASLVQPFMASMTAVIASTITNASTNAANIAAAATTGLYGPCPRPSRRSLL